MQTFFKSPRTSYPTSRCRAIRGFTLIELLISAAIITIVSSIILVRFSSFDSSVLLKSFAYEVATTVREAQIYSVSVFNTIGGDLQSFRYPYGLSFTPGATNYYFFRYNNVSSAATPRYESASAEVTLVRSIPVSGSMEVFDVCVTISGIDNCTIDRLDISFRRPEFSGIFYAPALSAAQLANISAGKVYLRSTKNTNSVWIVEVKLLGQISVYKQ